MLFLADAASGGGEDFATDLRSVLFMGVFFIVAIIVAIWWLRR
jgi:hypothetical protein